MKKPQSVTDCITLLDNAKEHPDHFLFQSQYNAIEKQFDMGMASLIEFDRFCKMLKQRIETALNIQK